MLYSISFNMSYHLQKEEERLRAAVRRESLQKRVRERNTHRSGGITASYLEPEEVMNLYSNSFIHQYKPILHYTVVSNEPAILLLL